MHLIGFELSCFHCHVSRNFFISLLTSSVTCWLFRNVLFNLCVCVSYSFFFLSLISSLIVLWSEKMLDMVSILLNLVMCDLWPKLWSILDNVPCALEKKVYFSAFGWNVLKITMRSISSNVSFKTCVSLLILCSDDPSTGVECGVKVSYCYCVTVNFSFYVC